VSDDRTAGPPEIAEVPQREFKPVWDVPPAPSLDPYDPVSQLGSPSPVTPPPIAPPVTPATSASPLGPAETPPPTRSGALGLERHAPVKQRSSGVVDWVALVLSVIAPPVGILAAIAAIVLGLRRNGFSALVAKIALAIGVVLSIILGAGLFAVHDAQQRQAAHDAIVASSAEYCSQLKANPGLLSSPTYGFPGAADTIPDSIAAVQKYETFWTGLAKVAPAGIKVGTQNIATAADSILTSISTSRVFDESSNDAEMQGVVSTSGVDAWVSQYCN
jgi:hypothetical protein